VTPRRVPTVDPLRVTAVRDVPVRRGDHVLYWMTAQRRTRWNLGLQHAVARAIELDRPLVILEALRVGYRYASDRFHRFVLDGMADNAAACAAAGATYLRYVEPEAGAGRGLLAALAARAALVVTDETPMFFLPRMIAAAGAALPVRIEQVDGVGVLPLRAFDRTYSMAIHFRRAWQKVIAPHLTVMPVAEPLAGLPRALRDAAIPAAVLRQWPSAGDDLARLPIDHEVGPVPYQGGARAATTALDRFVATGLDGYAEARNHPDDDATSGLSPYLHFGHIGAHEIVARVLGHAGWDPSRLAGARATGDRAGWWGAPASVEAFLEQVITWRELGHNAAHLGGDQTTWGSLPEWARATLDAHRDDPRPHLYTRAQLATAATGDPLWNAAQTQLLREGRIHNFLRMQWGKQVLLWQRSPRTALEILIELNDRYAVDGRDPNSYSGIGWVFGRFDRPWPERAILGNVRAMSAERTAKKVRVAAYRARFSDGRDPTPPRRGRGA
jgi:deoxyribodipyrimidine photo-lyase